MNKKILSIGVLSILFVGLFFAEDKGANQIKYISPNNDGVQDELVIPLNISDKRYIQAWSLVIMDSKKDVVRVIENKIALPEKVGFKSFFKQLVTPKKGVIVPETVTWNGAMNNGETAPDGTYYYYLTATDDNNNVGKTKEYEVIIDTLPPEIEVAQPTDKIFGEGVKSTFKIKQTGSLEDEWTGTFKSVDGKMVKTYKWVNAEPAEFSWNGTDDSSNQVLDGVYTYEITATDRAGNVSLPTSVSNIIYSAEKPATNIYIDGSRYFSPETESKLQKIKFNLSIPVPETKTGNKLVEWAVIVEDKSSKSVRTYNQLNNGDVPPSVIIFDGKDDKGKLLPNGEYQAFVTAKYLNGYVPTKLSSPIIVLDTEKPSAQITASEKVFGAGAKDCVQFTIQITKSSGSPVPSWKGQIVGENGNVVKSYDFGEYPPETVIWNGVSDKGEIAEKGKYNLILSGTDLAGNIGGGTTKEYVTFDTTETQLLLTASDTAFSPNGNKIKDTISITPITATKDVVAYEFTVKDKSGNNIYSVKENKGLPANFVWNGKNNEKKDCQDGIYFAQLSVTAANGSTATASTQIFELDTIAPKLSVEIPWSDFSPNGNGNQKKLPIEIKQCTSEKLWTADVRDSKDKTIKKYTWNGIKEKFEWDGADESGNISENGIYSIVLYSTDDAGNSFSTEIKEITLDNREVKAYITADYEGISPNNDKVLEEQKFEITTSVTDSILSWNFDIRREDGKSVYNLNQQASGKLPSVITWNGKDNSGFVCEGTFTGTIEILYKNGNSVSSVSSPFICTAIPPKVSVKTSPEYFSPDNDGADDELFIKLSAETKAKIKNWTFIIKDPKGKDFWKQSGKTHITERMIWDGLSNVQKDSKGNAERVQSAMDYPYTFTVTDNLGMTTVNNGVIPVDVLVIRDGSVLKMAVPSIIFESDSANFMNANAKLTQSQIDNNIKTLNRISDILKKFIDYKVTIVGHANKVTDNPLEETEDNLKEWGRGLMPLSKERADAIVLYLTKQGVNSSVLTTEGMGGTKPVVDPKDKDNNWKNRRVEFILQK